MDKTMRTATLLLALCTLAAHGQSWFNDDAEWHFAYGNLGVIIGYVHGTIGGDTILDGQEARKLELHRFASFIGSTQVYEEPVQDLVVRYADDIAWVYVPQLAAFDTLYAMNAVPGDRWQLAELPDDAPPCGPESYMEVTDTGTTMQYGPELRWLAVDIHYTSEWEHGVVHDTIVERIGTLGMYILPHDLCLAIQDGSEGGRPLCYQDGEIDYKWDPATPCDRALGVEAGIERNGLRLHPNPATQVVHIEWPHGSPALIEVYDGQGRLQLTQTVARAADPINISMLASGPYLLRVHHKHGVRSFPFVKE